VARHWNGRSWADAALPIEEGRGISVARASGPRNVWAFGGGDEGGDAYALRWNGQRWSVAHRWPGGDILSDAAVLSPRDVWVFGYSRAGSGIGTWHFDGRSWKQVETPAGLLGRASAVSADDIWAIGSPPPPNGFFDNALTHWDGHAWTRVDVPGLPQEETHFAEFRAIYAAASNDVWLVGDEYQSDGDDWGYTPLALHYDGHAWQRLDAPATGEGILGDVTSDGHGGIWVTPSVEEPYDSPELLHYAGGQWTEVRPQRPDGKVLRVHDVTTVPRSRSTWAVGEVFPADRETSDGAVWVNGPLPR
jgi:hypothetical protein